MTIDPRYPIGQYEAKAILHSTKNRMAGRYQIFTPFKWKMLS